MELRCIASMLFHVRRATTCRNTLSTFGRSRGLCMKIGSGMLAIPYCWSTTRISARHRTRLADHGQHLLMGQEPEHGTLAALGGDSKGLLEDMQGRDVAAGGELQERTQGHETQIAAPHAVVALLFKIIEERQDQRGLEIAEPSAHSTASRWPHVARSASCPRITGSGQRHCGKCSSRKRANTASSSCSTVRCSCSIQCAK